MPRPVVPIGAAAARLLAQRVEVLVPGEDDVGVLGDEQLRVVLRGSRAACSASISATSTPGSTTTPLPMTHALPGWRMPEGIRCSTVFWPPTTSVWPGVVAALEAHHHLGVLGEQVDDLALSLVAPLGADDDDVRHRGPGL